MLERALLIAFREAYGEVPKCNAQGRRTKARAEFVRYFRRRAIDRIIDDLS